MASNVQAIASTMINDFRMVGVDEKRESTSTVTDMSAGAAPLRSLKMPTTCGRRSPSSRPWTGWPLSSVSPVKAAEVYWSFEVISMAAQRVLWTSARGAVATTTLRSRTSTFDSPTRTNRLLRAAPSPCGGAVASNSPPDAGSAATAEHGRVADSRRGAWDTSGASTSCRRPFCGHSILAVVCVTGANGVISANSTPSMPATIAISRGIRT